MSSSGYDAPASCVELNGAPTHLQLNASALSATNSFYVPLTSPSSPSINALLDSGSSHCFIDFDFAKSNSLHLRSIPPIPLRLFDGTCNAMIHFVVDLSVTFPFGKTMDILFYVTKLDSPSTAVLGFNWLATYNLLVDWTACTLTFPSATPDPARPPPLPAVSSPKATPLELPPPPTIPSNPPSLALIGAMPFGQACRLPGSQVFQIRLRAVSANSSTEHPAPDLSGIPPEYHDYADVFSEQQAFSLPPHRPYDLKIELDEGKPIPPGRLYSLSVAELGALRKFLDENLSAGFLRQSSSPHGAPVLFVKKKDGSLRLCVDFRALNRLTKKDHYPLPLISDLLQSLGNARYYTKIDLRHAYHLVRVADSDE